LVDFFENQVTSGRTARNLVLVFASLSFLVALCAARPALASIFGLFGQTDVTNPTAPVLVAPKNESYLNNPNPTFTWQITSDPGLATGISRYRLYIDGFQVSGDFTSSPDSNLISYTLGANALVGGQAQLSENGHSWSVRAYDHAGNYTESSVYTFKVDLTPPQGKVQISGGQSVTRYRRATLYLTALDPLPEPNPLNLPSDFPAGVKSFRVGLSDSFDATAAPWQDWQPPEGNQMTTTLTLPAEAGEWAVYVQYLDKAGNISEAYRVVTTYRPTWVSQTIETLVGLPSSLTEPKLDLDVVEEKTVPYTEEEKFSGEAGQEMAQFYAVRVQVVDDKKDPVAGAQVTLASDPRTTITDAKGWALFDQVPAGEHTLTIAYEGYEGQKRISLSGEVKEFSYVIQVRPVNPWLSPPAIILLPLVVLLLGFVIYFLAKR